METDTDMSAPRDHRPVYEKYWKIFTLMVIGGIIAVIGTILVIFWFVESTAIGNYGNATFNDWTLALMIEFTFKLILWILLIIGLPSCVATGLFWLLWWKPLPTDEKVAFESIGTSGKKHHGKESGGFSFFMFLAYVIYIYSEGNFHTPFGELPYSYWIFSYLWAIIWLLVIFGIPLGIAAFIYLVKNFK